MTKPKQADLVEQQTTTTGTGAYTVSGSVAGRRAFADVFVSDDVLPCVITDDAGNFECGFYKFDASLGTLTRTAITASSNAGAAVNWAAGAKRVYVADHAAATGSGARNNLNAADNTFPDTTHNDTLGYAQGSLWGTNDTGAYFSGYRLFVLNSIDTFHNAFWAELPRINNPTSAGSASFALSDPARNGAGLNFYCYDVITGGSMWWQQGNIGLTLGLGNFTDTDGIAHGGDAFHTGAWAYTADATPTTMAKNGDLATNHGVRLGGLPGVVTITGTVTARERDAGDRKVWKFEVVASSFDGSSIVIDLNTFTQLFATAGAAAWAVTAVVDPNDSTDGIAIQVTGAAAKQITWSAEIHGSYAVQF